MDPATAAATNNRPTRKINTATAHEGSPTEKRLKTEQEEVDAAECARPRRKPRISVLLDHLRQPITTEELTELLHYAALGKTGGIQQPSWCRLHHQRKVEGVNVVIVEGLTQSQFYKHYLTMRRLRTKYTTRMTFMPSSNNVASEFFSSELPPSESHEKNDELEKELRRHPVISKYGTQRKGLASYVLTQQEMIKNHFPVKGMPGFEDFVSTDSVDFVTDSSPLYGLDCEMCETEKGNELARVSLVDSDGKCVLDELVKPQNRILNYLTRFSGITAAMLRPITTTLQDVQTKMLALLPGDTVLVGHSLDRDLVALKLIHPHVIDTSLLFRRDFGQRFKLKVLTEVALKRQIQTDQKNGHHPTEDAVAALELAQYFIKAGPRQVVERHMEELWGYTIQEKSSDCETKPTPSHRFADTLQRLGRSVTFIGKRADIDLDLSHQRWHNSDKEVLASFTRQPKCSFLSVLQFSSVSEQLKRSFAPQEQQHQQVCPSLRDMCVVFAGPLPAGFSERDVRKLFTCCGPVRKIKMLNTAVRVHAEVEFKLLEGAMLALKVLNGLDVQGQSITVQRPVYESVLDLDLTLDALTGDVLNHSHIYAVKLKPRAAEQIKCSAKATRHVLNPEDLGASSGKTVNGLPPADANDQWLQLKSTRSKLSEEKLRETFDQFGWIERIILPAKPGRRATHAFIQFGGSEDRWAALSFSEDLWKENYLICPSLTPSHLSSWGTMATPVTSTDAWEENERREPCTTPQDQEMEVLMSKLDRRLGKLFRSLPECTLSVVLLLGQISGSGYSHGLCFMEVK